MFDGKDAIQIPRVMLPVLHGGKDGWFKLRNLSADKRTIRAKVPLSPIGNPNVLIDRVTGVLSISGNVGHFTGLCQVVDEQAPAKF